MCVFKNLKLLGFNDHPHFTVIGGGVKSELGFTFSRLSQCFDLDDSNGVHLMVI